MDVRSGWGRRTPLDPASRRRARPSRLGVGDGEQRRHRLPRDAEALGQLVDVQPLGLELEGQLVGGREPWCTVATLHGDDGTNRAARCLA